MRSVLLLVVVLLAGGASGDELVKKPFFTAGVGGFVPAATLDPPFQTTLISRIGGGVALLSGRRVLAAELAGSFAPMPVDEIPRAYGNYDRYNLFKVTVVAAARAGLRLGDDWILYGRLGFGVDSLFGTREDGTSHLVCDTSSLGVLVEPGIGIASMPHLAGFAISVPIAHHNKFDRCLDPDYTQVALDLTVTITSRF